MLTIKFQETINVSRVFLRHTNASFRKLLNFFKVIEFFEDNILINIFLVDHESAPTYLFLISVYV